jgi:hypothetical protein
MIFHGFVLFSKNTFVDNIYIVTLIITLLKYQVNPKTGIDKNFPTVQRVVVDLVKLGYSKGCYGILLEHIFVSHLLVYCGFPFFKEDFSMTAVTHNSTFSIECQSEVSECFLYE